MNQSRYEYLSKKDLLIIIVHEVLTAGCNSCICPNLMTWGVEGN